MKRTFETEKHSNFSGLLLDIRMMSTVIIFQPQAQFYSLGSMMVVTPCVPRECYYKLESTSNSQSMSLRRI